MKENSTFDKISDLSVILSPGLRARRLRRVARVRGSGANIGACIGLAGWTMIDGETRGGIGSVEWKGIR